MISELLLEEVGRALLLQVKANLPQALIDVAAEKTPEDAAFFAALGQDVPPTELVMIPDANWYEGHYPTLLDGPMSTFPNLTVMCYNEQPRPVGNAWDTDQGQVTSYSAYLELFCADPDMGTVNRKAKRYASALHRAVVQDLTLGGLMNPPENAPGAMVSNSSARYESQENNRLQYIQGCRVEYTFDAAQRFYD